MVMLTFILVVVPAAAAGTTTVTGITPATGINTTTISITDLTGSGFLSGATVMLTPVNVQPVHRGSIVDGGGGAPFLNNAYGVYVSDNYAYVASTGSNALEIVDISNPASPVHTGSIVNGAGGALLNSPNSVFVSGNFAYVASTGSNALEIVDISNPASPVHTGSIVNGAGGALLNSPYSVFVSGNYAYVASAGSDALEIVDISNPASPVHTGSIVNGTGGALLDWPESVHVSGNYAYVVSYYSSALEIVDVTDPANPVHFASLIDGGGSVPCLSLPTSVYVSGNYAYVTSAGSTALEIVNVTDPANPAHFSSLDNGNGIAPFLYDPRSVFISGNYAYVASAEDNTLEIVDVSNPANPAHAGSIQTGSGGALLNNASSVFVSGTYAYVASGGNNALEIVDIGTITATGVNVAAPNSITCTFNLTGAVPGWYNVVVTNPDGSSGTLVSGFMITPPPAPVAAFTGSPLSGNAPLGVTFTDSSTGSSITSWRWDFGDGNITEYGISTNPFHRYINEGIYSVNLTVTNTGGSDSQLRSNYITVNTSLVAPVAAFTASPLSGNAPLGVSFTDSSTGSSITSWRWDFGDGNITEYGISTNPLHRYIYEGTYSVNLTVTNTGGSDSQLRSNYITVTTPSVSVSGDSDSDPTPVPTQLRSSMVTVNIGGGSSFYRAYVNGTGHSDLILTGIVASGPGQGTSPAPGTVYEYADLLPARYASIEKAILSFSVPQTWLDAKHLTPRNIIAYHLANSTWTALPTTLVKSEIGRSYYIAASPGLMRFAITADTNSSSAQPVQSPEPEPQTFGDMVPAATPPPSVSTPVALRTTEPPAQPGTQPSSGFSFMTILGAGIAGVIIIIGIAVLVRRRKTDL